MSRIDCETVEFLRFGGERSQLMSPDARYIRAIGSGEGTDVVQPSIDHEQFLRLLNQLRYEPGGSDGAARAARTELAEQAARFLPAPKARERTLTQVDLVAHAAELWAFPFEAAYAANEDWLSDTEQGVVLTRRLRVGFSDETLPWPARPRVLFAHAPVTRDLERPLIERHAEALADALAPWAPVGAIPEDLLAIREVTSLAELRIARESVAPTYVHLLAHGAPTPRDPLLPEKTVWGLRLGYEGTPGESPAAIADALAPIAGVPLVVTVAACDSANQTQILFASYSVVQELHRRGIPVVVGSQLPLTKPGSVELTRAFYQRLLVGEDVRRALHAGRVALHQSKDAGHDWLSLVGYVRLPAEGYARHLMEFGLRAELGMLNAAQKRADRLSLDGTDPTEFATVAALVGDRCTSLAARRTSLDPTRNDLIDECDGLLASSYKRLAELLFSRAQRIADAPDDDRRKSRAALETSLASYRKAYERNVGSHWLGIQQLALEAALYGRLTRPMDLDFVRRAAELARDRNEKDYWPCGTIAEAWLLEPIAGRPSNLAAARDALTALRERVPAGEDGAFAIASTRRQLERYDRWWTKANGFFGDREDLREDASRLAELLA